MDQKPTRRGKEFKRFEELARKLVKVPKEDVEKEEQGPDQGERDLGRPAATAGGRSHRVINI